MEWIDWYNSLKKPTWTPSPATIGLIWQVLYPILLASAVYVFVQTWRRRLPFGIAIPFLINLPANFLFTPIQFGLRNLELATIDLAVVWASCLWSIVVLWPKTRVLACAQLPYLAWLSVAGVLQISITLANR